MFIRQATPDDAFGMAKVHVQGWRESYKDIVARTYLDSLSVPDRTASWGRFLAMDNSILHLVACTEKGGIIGFCGAGPIRKESAVRHKAAGEVYAIYLLDAYKNQGLGTLLWDTAVDYLHTHHLTPYIVWALEKNMPARRFYEKKDAVQVAQKGCIIGGISYNEIGYVFAP